MNVGWLIDGDMFPHYRDELVAAIQTLGHTCKLIQAPSPPFRWEDAGCSYKQTFPPDHCVVSHGDIALVSKIHIEQRWRPGAFATIENYFCSNYVNYFGQYWLNQDYMMLPFGDLKRQKQLLFDKFGRAGRIFVRPDSPLKLFTGQPVSFETFDSDLEYMGFYEFPIRSLVVVSSPKTVTREWRFVAASRDIVAGCLYCENGKFESKPSVDEDAKSLAEVVASQEYLPDPVWIIDICQTADREYHLLEIGGFSFADLYSCNKLDIVKSVSEAALAQWRMKL
ncbi:MAG: ATP-grasp domain-containing protein [Planctomycetota bacterium]